MKFLLTKVTYESFYAVWKVISLVADLVYKLVCFLDSWLNDHEL